MAFLDFVKLVRESLSVENDFDSCEGLLTGEDAFFGSPSNTPLEGLFDNLFVSDLDNDELLLRDLPSSLSESVLRLNGDDRRTTLDALPSVSASPSAADFLFFAGDGDRELGIHDLRRSLADKWFADCAGSSCGSIGSAEAGVLRMGAVIAWSGILVR